MVIRALRLLPVAPAPASTWLELPPLTAVDVADDAGVVYAQDLVATEGFYVVLASCAAWVVLRRWLARRP
jgi:hypothetical protein